MIAIPMNRKQNAIGNPIHLDTSVHKNNTLKIHYENLPVQNTEILKVVKIEKGVLQLCPRMDFL